MSWLMSEMPARVGAAAASGNVGVDGAVLAAVRGIRFDHQHGTVNISGAWIQAPVLQTGGTGAGTTKITGTRLTSAGTAIDIGKGASMVMTGNAKITQT